MKIVNLNISSQGFYFVDKNGQKLPLSKALGKIFGRFFSVFLDLELYLLWIIGYIPSHIIRKLFYLLAGIKMAKGSTFHMGARFYKPWNISIGEGTIVGRGAAIENRCRIGRRCKLETNAYITGSSELEDYVFVAPMVTTSNDNYMGRSEERRKHYKGVTIRRGGRVGANATVLPGKVIEADGMVAAGSVVTRDVPAGVIVAGVPARPLRPVSSDQLVDSQEDTT